MSRILFVGTKGEREQSTKYHKYHSSILVLLDNGKRILIDYGYESPSIEELDPDVILVTHAHPDHIGGLENLEIDIPVYMTPYTDKLLDVEKYPIRNRVLIRCNREYDLYGMKVIPYRVYHSVRCPTVGFLLHVDDRKIWYCPDYLHLTNYTDILRGIDVWIGDGSSLDIPKVRVSEIDGRTPYGHRKIRDQIEQCKKIGCKIFIITHLGEELLSMNDREVEDTLSKEFGIRVIIARDGMELDLSRLDELLEVTSKDLDVFIPIRVDVEEVEPESGIYLVDPHGEWIWKGLKTGIVKSKKYSKYIGVPLYLLSKDKCYGIIVLGDPIELENLDQFLEYQYKHLVSDRERREWWNDKFPLYYYPIRIVKLYPIPRRVLLPRGVQTFVSVENIVFEDRMIRDWRTYDPSTVDDRVLLDDHRITHMWIRWLQDNPTKRFTSDQFRDLSRREQIEVIRDLHDRIVREMEKRGMDHNTPIEIVLSLQLPIPIDEITPSLLSELTDSELLELHLWLHRKFREYMEKRE